MNPPRKFKVLIDAPCFSRSGYGGVADGLVPQLLTYPHFDARVILTNWGTCVPRQTTGPHDQLIRSRIIAPQPGQTPPCDICISVSLPELSQPHGRIFNINFTAGLETDSWPDGYMGAMNRWDLTVFQSTFAEKMARQSRVKPTRKIEILPWCQDTDIFKPDATPNPRIDSFLETVAEAEAFLYVGQRTHANPYMDRKNICKLIQCFCEAFKGRANRPALILKFHGTNFSTFDRDHGVAVIQHVRASIDPTAPIYLLHGEMTDQEMNALYNHPKIIAATSFTRGEGFGGSLLQSSLAGVPAIASHWSGHLDYLDILFTPLFGELVPIPDEAVSGWFERGSKWYEVDGPKAVETFRKFFDTDYREECHLAAASLAKLNAQRFSLAAQQKRLYAILDKHLLGKGAA